MNIKTLCLSILYENEATGYEIRRLCVEGECSYFVEASFGSIYPALARLEEEGMVQSRTQAQSGRPAKKIYAITDKGRAAFIEQLSAPLADDVFRSPFLLFARFAHILPRELVEARANEFLENSVASRKKLDDVAAERDLSAADLWIINFGRAIMDVAQGHMRSHMHELVSMAKAEPSKDAAE